MSDTVLGAILVTFIGSAFTFAGIVVAKRADGRAKKITDALEQDKVNQAQFKLFQDELRLQIQGLKADLAAETEARRAAESRASAAEERAANAEARATAAEQRAMVAETNAADLHRRVQALEGRSG